MKFNSQSTGSYSLACFVHNYVMCYRTGHTLIAMSHVNVKFEWERDTRKQEFLKMRYIPTTTTTSISSTIIIIVDAHSFVIKAEEMKSSFKK